MRDAYEMRRRAIALAFCLAAAAACAVAAPRALAFTIDPDPASPTIGDLLDREKPRPRRVLRPEPTPAAPIATPLRPAATPERAPVQTEKSKPLSPVAAPPARIVPAPAAPQSQPRIAAPVPKKMQELDPFRLPENWPVLEDERPPAVRPVTAPKPVVAVPHVPRHAATVIAPRLVARPRLPVMPEIPPLPALAEQTATVVVPPNPVPPVAEAAPAPVSAPLPPRRLEARQISYHRVPSPDVALLRDPTDVTGSIPAAAGAAIATEAKAVVQPLPAKVSPRLVADAAAPPVRSPAPVLVAESQATPPRPVRATNLPARPPAATSTPSVAEAPPPRPVPVALPPLEEPPRIAPRARAPEPAPPPKTVAPAPQPAPPTAPTAPPDGDRFVYVIDQDLRQFLTDFSRRVGLRADVQASVRGRLTRVKLPLEPTALLRDLEKRFDIEWLIEGEILKVASRSDLATRILPLGPVPYDDLVRELRAIDVDITRYPMKRLSESNAVILTAPSAYIGRVQALIETLRAGRSVGPELRIVRSGVTRKVEWE